MKRGASSSNVSLRCGVYTRKSSEEGLDQEYNSLHAQRDACEAYVRSQAGEGWKLSPAMYDDGGFSGGNIERPGLQRLLADIAAGRIDVVVVYKVDRLTRSLSDFARIVDVLDKAGASFVAVTQSFNTTTSMGRLTLNMLLSFAQFEREVTGERIRDKIAASKRKGMWMGGVVPLGYEPDGRTLKINPAEAELVGRIYERYLELGSVHALRDALAAEGVGSKRWTTSAGVVRGGAPFGRGALFHLLSNRLYIGEVPHKEESYPGLHAPIIDRALFDAVQAKLLVKAGAAKRARAGKPATTPAALLTGLIRDDRGNAMSPVSAKRPGGRIYRYYVSSATLTGAALEAGSLARASATRIEEIVWRRAERLGFRTGDDAAAQQLRHALQDVVVSRHRVRITFRRSALNEGAVDLEHVRTTAQNGEVLEVINDNLSWVVPACLSRRGLRSASGPGGNGPLEEARPDKALLKALIRAECWKQALLTGEFPTIQAAADKEGIALTQAQRMLRHAFLRPSIKRLILEGRAPASLTLQRVMTRGVPLDWAAHLHHLTC
jgi:DNA invertase Pin-like site-specific DNA recombinase